MPHVHPVTQAEALQEAQAELSRQYAAHGRVTNMKRTLARSPVALEALMQWYPLYEATIAFLGRRAAVIFVHAISTGTGCLICSTFFRRWLIDAGEDPEALQFDEREKTLLAFAEQIVRDANGVDDQLFARLASFLTPEQIVTLTAFAGLMVATNIFNNAMRVDLDDYLQPYRRPTTGTGDVQE